MRLCSRICFGVFSMVCACALSDSAENSEDEKPDAPEDLNHTFFITEIFDKYGNNNFMTYEGFEHLLENLGLGKLKFEKKHDVSVHRINGTFLEVHDTLSLHKHNHVNNVGNGSRRKRNLRPEGGIPEINLRRKCLTAQDILTTYGLQPHHDVVISPSVYKQICPAIVYELDQKLCQAEEALEVSPKQEERHLVWIYASATVFVMGAAGMLCVLVVPLVKNNYGTLQQFLIALAVGTLGGDALIHLFPQVLSRNGAPNSEVIIISRGTVALLAIYVFFIIENVLKGIQNQRRESEESTEAGKMLPLSDFESHGHGHSHGPKGIKSVAWMAIMGDILHNVTDGLSIGAAFGSSLSSGFASSIAIFCHELPHELGDYAILLASGMSARKSLFYNFVSSVFSFFGMVAGVLLGKIEDASLWINAFTAGSFLYIALSDLVPEMKMMQSKYGLKGFIIQTLGLGCGGILMFTIAVYENQIENMLS